MRNHYNKCIENKHFSEFPSEEDPDFKKYNRKRSMLDANNVAN